MLEFVLFTFLINLERFCSKQKIKSRHTPIDGAHHAIWILSLAKTLFYKGQAVTNVGRQLHKQYFENKQNSISLLPITYM